MNCPSPLLTQNQVVIDGFSLSLQAISRPAQQGLLLPSPLGGRIIFGDASHDHSADGSRRAAAGGDEEKYRRYARPESMGQWVNGPSRGMISVNMRGFGMEESFER